MLSSAFVSSSFAEMLFAASFLVFQPPSGYLWQSLSATYIDILKRAAPGEKPRLSKANCIHLIGKKGDTKYRGGKRPCLRPLFRRSSPHLALQKRFQIHFADSPFTANLQRRDQLLRDHFRTCCLVVFSSVAVSTTVSSSVTPTDRRPFSRSSPFPLCRDNCAVGTDHGRAIPSHQSHFGWVSRCTFRSSFSVRLCSFPACGIPLGACRILPGLSTRYSVSFYSSCERELR